MEFDLVILFLLVGGVFSAVPVTPDMKSFSSAIKGGNLPSNTEKTLYEHSTGQAGVITEQWFTGRDTIQCPVFITNCCCRSRCNGRGD